MIDPKLVERINELARKKKSIGLSEIELKEQQKLRKKYLKQFRSSMREQLDRIEFVDDHSSPKH